MGTRALRTGQLVASVWNDLNLVDRPPLRDRYHDPVMYCGTFSFGLYLANVVLPNTGVQGQTLSWVYVLDSRTLALGWVQRKYVRRLG